MKRSLRAVAVLAVCASALAVAGGVAARSRIVIVNSYAGHYEGFFDSAVTGQIATFTMDIAPSRTPIYSGLLLSAGLREPFLVAIGGNGGFIAGGTGPSGFLAVGKANPIAGGASVLATAAYLLRTPSGLDHGSLRFLRSFPAGDASQLPASLSGRCTDATGAAATVALRVETAPGPPDFGGDVAIGGVSAPLVGSIGNPDLRTGLAPLVATAVSTQGSIDFDGSWVSGGQPHMQGTATVTLADGSVSTETNCVLVPAVQVTTGGQ
jgi:hypothetical protein